MIFDISYSLKMSELLNKALKGFTSLDEPFIQVLMLAIELKQYFLCSVYSRRTSVNGLTHCKDTCSG